MKYDMPVRIYPESPLKSAFRKSLRAKLLLGYMIFVFALAGFGGWSARRMHQMGGISNRIIKDNYDSVVAAQNMKDSLERVDSASLLILFGYREPIMPRVVEYRARFDRAFNVARGNITETEEPRVLEEIQQERDAYYAALNALFTSPNPADRDMYLETLEPAFDRLHNSIENLLRLNQQAMVSKSDAARAIAGRWFVHMLVVTGLMAISGLGVAIWLADRVVRPLHKIAATAAQVAEGDFNARVFVRSDDEIGRLAREFNTMAGRLRHLQRIDKGKLLVAERVADATVDAIDFPIIVIDIEGRIERLNVAAESLFGKSSEVIGKRLEETKADEGLVKAVADELPSKRSEVAKPHKPVLISVNDEQRRYVLQFIPIYDDDNHLLGLVTFLDDRNRLRRLE